MISIMIMGSGYHDSNHASYISYKLSSVSAPCQMVACLWPGSNTWHLSAASTVLSYVQMALELEKLLQSMAALFLQFSSLHF